MIQLIESHVADHEGEAVAVTSTREGISVRVGHGFDESGLYFNDGNKQVILTREDAADLILALYKQGVDLPDKVLDQGSDRTCEHGESVRLSRSGN